LQEITRLYYLVYRRQTQYFMMLYNFVILLQNCVVTKPFRLYYTLLLIKKFFLYKILTVFTTYSY